MRQFSSYGPINPKLHYHAPRKELIEKACNTLVGGNPEEGGHYITVWAPRQCGKTWVMQEVIEELRQRGEYEVGIITMELAKEAKNETELMEILIDKLQDSFERTLPSIKTFKELKNLFKKQNFKKPVILVLDEFDALEEDFINRFAGVFRDMFTNRTNEKNKDSQNKTYLLHGLALIGVRRVLGIENVKGSPFNVQKSLHIPNLSKQEVNEMFQWYSKESKQAVDPEVIEALFYETRGQPGLTCWFGEQFTEKFNPGNKNNISMDTFEETYAAATYVLPNNNILNIISKAKKDPYRETVLELFKTDAKMEFSFDDEIINYLYMNGVIDEEKTGKTDYYVRFSSPFVQKRLFNYFSRTLFKQMGQLVKPFLNLDGIITTTRLDVPQLIKLYQAYLDRNRSWLFKDAPRRSDLRIYEAVFHFSLYSYLHSFLREKNAVVVPEFPTGNGKVDLIIKHNMTIYGLELKSYTDHTGYRRSLEQAARYGKQLGLGEMFLVIFIDTIDEQNRKTYEAVYHDQETSVTVRPIFITTAG